MGHCGAGKENECGKESLLEPPKHYFDWPQSFCLHSSLFCITGCKIKPEANGATEPHFEKSSPATMRRQQRSTRKRQREREREGESRKGRMRERETERKREREKERKRDKDRDRDRLDIERSVR